MKNAPPVFHSSTRRRIFHTMPKAKKAPLVGAPIVAMTYAEAEAMSQGDRITRLKFEADTQQRAFVTIGKLYDVIDGNLPKGEFINPTLEAAGVKPGTISNASYAARCYREFVKTEHITEDEYNQLTFSEMFNIIRVCTDKSKRKLAPADAVAIARSGGDFAKDLEAIFQTGMTAAEKAAIEATIKADKEKAEAEAKAKAEQQAKELAEVKKRNEELAKANADMTAQAAAASAPAPAAAAAAPATPAAPAAATPAAPAPAPAAATPAAATAEDLLALLDEVENSIAMLDEAGQGRVAARIVDLANALVNSGLTMAA
jgi:hypothetical protein